MDKRKLGQTGYEIAPFAFGGNVFGWTVDEPTSFKSLDAFVDAGFSLIDTADSYSRWVCRTYLMNIHVCDRAIWDAVREASRAA
jgi:aryl-alcohol dehydrogenase-like predicted oxidoreductase